MSSIYFTKRLVTKRPKPGANKPAKPKSFKTKESAEAWAKKYKVAKFRIEEISPGKFKLRTHLL